MINFKLIWLDSYNLDNWGSIENVAKVYPIVKHVTDCDGWTDCEHEFCFIADSIPEAKKTAIEYLENTRRNIDVFTLMLNEERRVLFTEENFYD